MATANETTSRRACAQVFGLALLQQMLRSGSLALVFLVALWLTGQRMPWQGEPGPPAVGGTPVAALDSPEFEL